MKLPTSILALTLGLGLTVLTTSCSGLGGTPSKAGHATTSCHGAATSDWKAWGNVQPGSDQSLHVKGKVTTSSGGWKVALQKRTPQGINPRILILDLAVTPPAPGSQTSTGIVHHEPTYKVKGAARSHDKVEIHCREGDKDKVLADLDVELAH